MKNFDVNKNRARFYMEIDAVRELIEFAIERKHNYAIGRAVLHAIHDHMHEIRNIYAPLQSNMQLLLEQLQTTEGEKK